MSMDEKKVEDLLAVLAAVAAAVPDADPEKARRVITDDFRASVAAEPRVSGGSADGTLCGHQLEIVDGERLLVGGGGVVIPCREAGGSQVGGAGKGRRDVRYALKIARPSLFEDVSAQEEEADKARLEYETHLPLAHENIAKMYSYQEIDIPVMGAKMKLTLPCTLIEWIDDARPFDQYVHETQPRPEEFAGLISQTCRALDHLHSAGMVHWDMKSDNLLVSGSGQVKLMDLGNARPLRAAGQRYKESEFAESTYGSLPPELHKRLPDPEQLTGEGIERPVSRNRVPCELTAGEEVWDRPWLDLHMFAREVNRVVAFDPHQLEREQDGEALLKPARRCAEQIFVGEDGEFVLGFTRRVLDRLLCADAPSAPPFYEAAEEVVQAFDRLLPEYGAGTDLPELQAVPQHVLRVPPNENIPWTGRIGALMDSETLLRLKRHRQLATVRHVYPGAEHTRWEHTIGTLGRALQSVRALYADRQSILFRLDTSKLDLTALMVATLLHDVGHPAFGHQLEESPLITDEHRHEAYAVTLLRGARDAADPADPAAAEIRQILGDHWCSPEFEVEPLLTRAVEILEGEFEGAGGEQEDRRVHLDLLHSLLVGPLDADKSDYLARDAHHCGVEYATGVDRKRLDQTLTALEVGEGSGAARRRTGVLGINRKGVLPLESMLVARYQLFRAVYWHHTVRAITVMLQELVEAYVLPPRASSEGHSERLERVLREFRELPDEQAVAWLASAVDESSGMTSADRRDLAWLAEGVLGARVALPWRAVEIFGTDSTDLQIYLELRGKWHRGEADSDGAAAVRERRALRGQIATAIAAEIDQDGLPEIAIREADVLLDVPIEGKDQVTGLYVADAYGGEPRSVHTVTPLAKAVADAFDLAVRPVRVFLRPAVAEHLGSGLAAEAKMSELVRTALRKTVLDQMQIVDDLQAQPG